MKWFDIIKKPLSALVHDLGFESNLADDNPLHSRPSIHQLPPEQFSGKITRRKTAVKDKTPLKTLEEDDECPPGELWCEKHEECEPEKEWLTHNRHLTPEEELNQRQWQGSGKFSGGGGSSAQAGGKTK